MILPEAGVEVGGAAAGADGELAAGPSIDAIPGGGAAGTLSIEGGAMPGASGDDRRAGRSGARKATTRRAEFAGAGSGTAVDFVS